ncbi:hypothetical protein LINPERPRIM_LOCUS12843 [Linum perenne]
MGKCIDCGKLHRTVSRNESLSRHSFAISLSPVVSFWDCIVRKMRYSYRRFKQSLRSKIMDSIAGNTAQPVTRKAKKKPVKGEIDRLKQAEKKKRRLEKALATSAAIRAELERKKQNKVEEQRRLDEEGAAIAEAVALHVLLGDDDSDKWDSGRNNVNLYNADSRNWSSFSYGFSGDEGWGTAEFSAEIVAARAVSSLQIDEDPSIDTFIFGRNVGGMMNERFSGYL